MEKLTAIFPFGGIGGGAIGTKMARPEAFGVVGQFEILCGMDVDPVACRNFEAFTGAPCYEFDFFSRQQYVDFHGHEPPEGWRELTPDDIWRACQYQTPDVKFSSAPCKGFSGLLGTQKAATKKYQALNQLAVRELELSLIAFEHDPIPVIIMENVPGIRTRGKHVLVTLKSMLKKAGYITKDFIFDCGEVGGLGERRKRYISLSRHPEKCAAEIFKPTLLNLKTIGDVIGPLPMPGDMVAGGPHHKEQRLSWKVALRLALIEAGKDWRYLNSLDWQNIRIQHEPRGGAFAVEDWNEPSRAVTGAAGPGRSNSATAVSDPRTGYKNDTHGNIYRLYRFDETGPTVTGAIGPNNGAACVCDPRLKERESRHGSVYQVVRHDQPSPCVTGTRFGSGALAVSDPRVSQWTGKYSGTYRTVDWEETSPTIIGQTDIQCGALSVSDPRVNMKLYPDCYGVQEWDESAKAVRGNERVMQSPCSIADPRIASSPRNGTYGVMEWEQPSGTVTGSGDVHAGTTSVADPRIPGDNDRGVWIIIALDGTRHRPLTTFELAMLQGMPQYMPDGHPFELVGVKSDAKAREYIGNLVPPPSAKRWMEEIGAAILSSRLGTTFRMSFQEVWVAPEIESESTGLLQ